MLENERRTLGGSQVNPLCATDEHLREVARKRTLSAPPPLCMQAVPANDHGITAVHPNRGEEPIPSEDLKKVFEGPMAVVAGEVAEEVSKPERILN